MQATVQTNNMVRSRNGICEYLIPARMRRQPSPMTVSPGKEWAAGSTKWEANRYCK